MNLSAEWFIDVSSICIGGIVGGVANAFIFRTSGDTYRLVLPAFRREDKKEGDKGSWVCLFPGFLANIFLGIAASAVAVMYGGLHGLEFENVWDEFSRKVAFAIISGSAGSSLLVGMLQSKDLLHQKQNQSSMQINRVQTATDITAKFKDFLDEVKGRDGREQDQK